MGRISLPDRSAINRLPADGSSSARTRSGGRGPDLAVGRLIEAAGGRHQAGSGSIEATPGRDQAEGGSIETPAGRDQPAGGSIEPPPGRPGPSRSIDRHGAEAGASNRLDRSTRGLVGIDLARGTRARSAARARCGGAASWPASHRGQTTAASSRGATRHERSRQDSEAPLLPCGQTATVEVYPERIWSNVAGTLGASTPMALPCCDGRTSAPIAGRPPAPDAEPPRTDVRNPIATSVPVHGPRFVQQPPFPPASALAPSITGQPAACAPSGRWRAGKKASVSRTGSEQSGTEETTVVLLTSCTDVHMLLSWSSLGIHGRLRPTARSTASISPMPLPCSTTSGLSRCRMNIRTRSVSSRWEWMRWPA